jgi:hypothetical protein
MNDDRRRALRGEIAMSGRKLYQVAAAAGVHPTYLSGMLAGRFPLSDDVERRVRLALQ